jgi:hypothetical protein
MLLIPTPIFSAAFSWCANSSVTKVVPAASNSVLESKRGRAKPITSEREEKVFPPRVTVFLDRAGKRRSFVLQGEISTTSEPERAEATSDSSPEGLRAWRRGGGGRVR